MSIASSGPEAAVTPNFIPVFGFQGGLTDAARMAGGLGNPATITWVANLAVFIPVTIPWPYPVRRVWWFNGSTITTSNADFGIYGLDGTRLYSTGSTALSGASVIQYVDPTDFLLPPGRYFFAYSCDNTTSRSRGWTGITTLTQRQAGILQQSSAFPLPTTMGSAGAASQALVPTIGVTRTASGF